MEKYKVEMRKFRDMTYEEQEAWLLDKKAITTIKDVQFTIKPEEVKKGQLTGREYDKSVRIPSFILATDNEEVLLAYERMANKFTCGCVRYIDGDWDTSYCHFHKEVI